MTSNPLCNSIVNSVIVQFVEYSLSSTNNAVTETEVLIMHTDLLVKMKNTVVQTRLLSNQAKQLIVLLS